MQIPLTAVSKEDFLKANYIYFTNINIGFSLYNFVNLTLKDINLKANATDFFSRFLIDEFEKTNSPVFVDFYIQDLDDEEISNLRKLLSPNYRNTLDSLLPLKDSKTFFFEIKDKSIIPFLTELSTKELFFTTFYFKNFTLWGNYNLSFPLFYNEVSCIDSLLISDGLTYK